MFSKNPNVSLNSLKNSQKTLKNRRKKYFFKRPKTLHFKYSARLQLNLKSKVKLQNLQNPKNVFPGKFIAVH